MDGCFVGRLYFEKRGGGELEKGGNVKSSVLQHNLSKNISHFYLFNLEKLELRL